MGMPVAAPAGGRLRRRRLAGAGQLGTAEDTMKRGDSPTATNNSGGRTTRGAGGMATGRLNARTGGGMRRRSGLRKKKGSRQP